MVHDAEGRFVFCNPGAERILRVSAGEVLGNSWESLLPGTLGEDGVPLATGQHPGCATLRSGRPAHDLIVGLPAGEGEVTWICVNAQPVALDHAAVVLTLADITQKRQADLRLKQAEKALEESEERLRLAAEGTQSGTFDIDRQSGKRVWSPMAKRLFGFPPDADVSYDAFVNAVHPEDRARVHTEVQALLTPGQEIKSFSEFRIIKPDGEERWVSSWGRTFFDDQGRPVRLIGLTQDITERKRAEQALRESEARLRLIFDQAPIGACMVGLDRLFLRVNAAFCRFLGYEEHELLGKYMPEITHPDYRAADHENAISLEQGKSDPYRADKCYLRKDGTAVWGHVTVRLLRDPAGRPLYFVAMVEDITEHKKAAEEHQRLQAQLQQAQKMESIGRLAGGVAHDFNNLLTVINGYSALAMNRLRDDPLFETVQEIHKAGEAAAALVRQLLAFSRKQLLCEELVDLNDMVRDMRKMLLPLLGEHIEIVAALASSLDPVLADRHQIEQVLMNLAVNARDAMPQGGVLTIATDSVTAGPFCHQCMDQMRPGRYVRVTVRDTGSGMDAQTREHLFEPFFSTKQPGHGTGLGLATVHGIVLQSGGHIDVESEPGRGAIFRVYLPAADGHPPSPSPQLGVVQADPPHGQETILLVEDQAEVRRFVASALQERGYRVLVASSGEEALSHCAEAPVDLLLTDVVMPRMGGCELAALLQSRQPRAKVLFMSGYSEEILNGQAHGVRGAALIQKPFTPHTLARKIREILGS